MFTFFLSLNNLGKSCRHCDTVAQYLGRCLLRTGTFYDTNTISLAHLFLLLLLMLLPTFESLLFFGLFRI